MTFKEFQLTRQQKGSKSVANYNTGDQDGLPAAGDMDIATQAERKNNKNRIAPIGDDKYSDLPSEGTIISKGPS